MISDDNDTTAFVSTKVTLDEVTLNVIDVGEGSPVLLLHGFPDRASMWRHQIHALLEAGHRVIAPDLRGFGDSGLSWYRANLFPEIFALNQVNLGMSTIICPVLGIWSDGDPALGEQQMTDSEKYLSGTWCYEKIIGVDHWIPLHAATRTNELLVEFFT